jgi:hypothetical protein
MPTSAQVSQTGFMLIFKVASLEIYCSTPTHFSFYCNRDMLTAVVVLKPLYQTLENFHLILFFSG